MAVNVELEITRKSQIIDAALKRISEVGFHNVTMEDIAEESGLSKGGIAHYYSSKGALFKDVFKAYFDRIFQRGKETMDRYDDPLEKLLSFQWLYNRDDPELDTGYPIHFDFMALASRDSEYQKIFHNWVGSWVRLLGEALGDGVNSGMFIVADIEETARTISAIYHGIAIRWFLDSKGHSSEWAVESLKSAVTHFMSNYIK